MALTSKQKRALYLLMGAHGDNPDDKSEFRATVEQNTPQGADYKLAFAAAAYQLDNSIKPEDIKSFTALDGASVRGALDLLTIYPGGGSSCPAGADQQEAFDLLTTP